MPTRITPVVLNMIIINVLVFVFFALNVNGLGETVGEYFSLYSAGVIWEIPQFSNADFDKFHPVQIVTYMFNHGGFMHLIFNMFGLVFIGTYVEKIMGSKNFLILYLFSGLFAGLLIALLDPSPIPTVGASGAIFGVLGAFAFFMPNARLSPLFIPISFKARDFMIGVSAISLVLLIIKNVVFFQNGGGAAGVNATLELGGAFNISHFGHMAGLAGGLLFLYRNKILGIFRSR